MRAVDGEHRWDAHAAWWQQQFTGGADVEYEEQIIPLVVGHLRGAQRILDVGCGEGQVARRLAAEGARVVGIDPAAAQIGAAQSRGDGPHYARARAEQLPFRAGAFDTVVVCLAFEHVHDLVGAITEITRVLVPRGRLLLLVGHPLLQAPGSGWIDDKILDERYWRIGEYLRERTVIDEVAPGVAFEFIHRPIHRYVNALAAAGLLIEGMDEPAPPQSLLDRLWGYPEADTIPRFMALRARRVSGSARPPRTSRSREAGTCR
jgi:SAM-dependent methyltransferase